MGQALAEGDERDEKKQGLQVSLSALPGLILAEVSPRRGVYRNKMYLMSNFLQLVPLVVNTHPCGNSFHCITLHLAQAPFLLLASSLHRGISSSK